MLLRRHDQPIDHAASVAGHTDCCSGLIRAAELDDVVIIVLLVIADPVLGGVDDEVVTLPLVYPSPKIDAVFQPPLRSFGGWRFIVALAVEGGIGVQGSRGVPGARELEQAGFFPSADNVVGWVVGPSGVEDCDTGETLTVSEPQGESSKDIILSSGAGWAVEAVGFGIDVDLSCMSCQRACLDSGR